MVPGKGFAEEKSAESLLPCQLLWTVRTPHIGQPLILGHPAPTASRQEVRRGNFRFRWAKGKRNVNTGPGEWSSGNRGYGSVVEAGGS